ncbi:VanZ family protein [Ramlibacter monticola]|uniref:VanZ family protein n=1 Tax=Ramlibacter monticola TaxID=1926872 RepID=UPI0038B49A75
MVVPSSTIEYVTGEFEGVQQVLDFLDTVGPGMQLDHLVAFAVLGFVTHFAWPVGRSWQVATAILAVGTLPEIVQIWIPGREAAVSHAVLNIVGGVIGFSVAWLCTYAWSDRSLPSDSMLRTIGLEPTRTTDATDRSVCDFLCLQPRAVGVCNVTSRPCERASFVTQRLARRFTW